MFYYIKIASRKYAIDRSRQLAALFVTALFGELLWLHCVDNVVVETVCLAGSRPSA